MIGKYWNKKEFLNFKYKHTLWQKLVDLEYVLTHGYTHNEKIDTLKLHLCRRIIELQFLLSKRNQLN